MFNLLPLFKAFELTSGNVAAITLGIVALYVIYKVVRKMWKYPVVFIDSQTEAIIKEQKQRNGSKVRLFPAVKDGEKFIGWSYTPDGSKPCEGKNAIVNGKTFLYAMWERPIAKKVIAIEDANMYVELAYADEAGKIIRKETMPLIVNPPKTYNDYGRFQGWKNADGEVMVKKHYDGSVISLTLKPVFSKEVGTVDKEHDDYADIDSFSVEDANMYVEFVYCDFDGQEIATNLLPVIVRVPSFYKNVDGFEGWGLDAQGTPDVDKDVDGSVLSFKLTPAGIDKVYKPLADEVKEEAPVEEAPAEEVVEEVKEETPVEEAVEEVKEEAPVEEAAEEAKEEAPVEEAAEEAKEEAPVEEKTEEAPVEEKAEEAPAEEVAPTIVPTYFDNEGNHIDIRYIRSFISNVIQGDEQMKEFYSELKNHILSYDGVKSRLSWKFDSYNRGRDQLFKIKIRGKTICLYLALDPNDYDVSKYHHESIDAKIFEDVPMLFKIKSGLGLRKAKQLVDDTMAKFEIPQAEKPKFVDYVAKYPYTETEELVQQKLVKVLVSEGSIGAKSDDNADSADGEGDSTTIKVEETVAAPVEEVVEAPVVEATEEIHIVESVSADEADSLVADEIVNKTVESDVEYVTKKDTKKDVVNVGELSDAYNAGEVVDLKSLKEKGLIDPRTKTLKVLASGTINKPLIVKAHVFSETALKMIVLTGGKVVKVTSKVK